MLPYGQGGWPFQGRTKGWMCHDASGCGIVKVAGAALPNASRIGQEAARRNIAH
jgi:hypothetical protein